MKHLLEVTRTTFYVSGLNAADPQSNNAHSTKFSITFLQQLVTCFACRSRTSGEKQPCSPKPNQPLSGSREVFAPKTKTKADWVFQTAGNDAEASPFGFESDRSRCSGLLFAAL